MSLYNAIDKQPKYLRTLFLKQHAGFARAKMGESSRRRMYCYETLYFVYR